MVNQNALIIFNFSQRKRSKIVVIFHITFDIQKKMSAKGKGKGKGKGLKIDSDVLKRINNQHDGALDSSYFV